MAACSGNAVDHCCYLGPNGACPYLEENTVENRRWACGLRRELGSWDAVHADERYVRDVAPAWNGSDTIIDCGSWPRLGVTCGTCGVSG